MRRKNTGSGRKKRQAEKTVLTVEDVRAALGIPEPGAGPERSLGRSAQGSRSARSAPEKGPGEAWEPYREKRPEKMREANRERKPGETWEPHREGKPEKMRERTWEQNIRAGKRAAVPAEKAAPKRVAGGSAPERSARSGPAQEGRRFSGTEKRPGGTGREEGTLQDRRAARSVRQEGFSGGRAVRPGEDGGEGNLRTVRRLRGEEQTICRETVRREADIRPDRRKAENRGVSALCPPQEGRRGRTASGVRPGRETCKNRGKPAARPGTEARDGRKGFAARQAREGRGAQADAVVFGKKKDGISGGIGNFVVQGTILAAAGIIVRLIGLLYRIPMTNIIGDEGMGYYSTAFNVYNLVLILSSYSLPLAVSKLVSARLARGEFRNASRVLWAALLYATFAGGLACGAVWRFGGFFAESVFKTPFCVYALKTLAPTIWIMAYLGVLRGYFQGHGTMVPTAVSQILEQIVNAAISVVAAGVLFKVGLDSNKVFETSGYPEAFGAAGGTVGTGAGAAAALLFMLFLFAVYRPVMRKKTRWDRQGNRESYRHITGVFCLTVLPVILSSAVYNVNAVIDNSIMAYGMDALGRGGEFLALWGIYNNKYLLLVHVPLAMANALSSSLIPSLSAAVARGERGEAARKTGMAIRFSMMIAIPAAVGLTVLAEPINRLLFHSGDTASAVRMMVFGSSAIVFLSLSTVMNAILQGLGHMNVPVRNAAVSLVIHVAALYVMLMVLKWGIYSVLFANILFAAVICVLNGRAIRRYLRCRQEIRRTFLIPAAASALMGAAAYGCYGGLSSILQSNAVPALVSILAGAAVYGCLLLKLGGVKESELASIPGGGAVVTIGRRLRLL